VWYSWGLSDGKDGVYDKQIAEAGAIPLLISMLQFDDAETRGFAAACLLCLCNDVMAHGPILESGGADLLQALSYHQSTWLRGKVVDMLTLLKVPVPNADQPPPQAVIVAREQLASAAAAANPSKTPRSPGRGPDAALPNKTPRSPGSPEPLPNKTPRSQRGTSLSRLSAPTKPLPLPPVLPNSSRPAMWTARMCALVASNAPPP
jgi:hypothetical protein